MFAIAQRLVDAGVTLDQLPANTCCDRYTFVVVVGIADGTSTTYTALDGEPMPTVFSSLLNAVRRESEPSGETPPHTFGHLPYL